MPTHLNDSNSWTHKIFGLSDLFSHIEGKPRQICSGTKELLQQGGKIQNVYLYHQIPT